MPTNTTRGAGFAIGFSRQPAGAAASTGSAVTAATIVAPNSTLYWPRWLQGSMHYPDAQYNHEFEGDGSRGESLAWRRFQYGKATIICYPRPAELGALMAALTGTGSDHVTAAAAGNDSAGNPNATEHDIYLPADDLGLDYYTVTSLIRGTKYCWQTADCLLHSITITGTKGLPIKVQAEFSGGVNQFVDSSLVTGGITVNPSPDGPYYFFDGTWVLNGYAGVPTDWAPAITDFSLKYEITLNPEDYQAEAVYPLPMVAGNMKVSGEITLFWQNGDAMRQAYFGAPANTIDVGTVGSAAIATGDLLLTLASSKVNGINDRTNTATLEFPLCAYEMATFEPDLQGKPVEQKIQIHALKGKIPTCFTTPPTTQSLYAARVNCQQTTTFNA